MQFNQSDITGGNLLNHTQPPLESLNVLYFFSPHFYYSNTTPKDLYHTIMGQIGGVTL